MGKLDQSKTPYIDALKKYVSEDVSPFDVPGHHMGNIDNAATELFGHELYRCDVNAPLGLDNLAKPTGVIYESERYLADACGADEAFYLINGTSSGIIAMILTAVKAGEKIILPRNVHKSVINALILSGAVPVYVMPVIDNEIEIADQPSLEDWKKAILRNPSAKAVFVINPTYFGSVGPLEDIVKFAHEHKMAVLCDEAHGAHYYFKCKHCPVSAMAAGADMSSASFHKTVGSLTQSSVLLMHNKMFSREDVQKSLNIINTTSPSGILIASIDAARSYMASKEGAKAMEETYELADYARKKIHKIPGFIDYGREHFLAHGSYNYDESKLVIELDKLDIDGFQLYRLLKTKYEVMMELAETYAILGIFAIGTKKEHVDHLINALKDISKEHYHPETVYPAHHFDNNFPFMLLRPRVAFHAPGKVSKVTDCDGAISKEQVMMYPPGIPLIVPGEVWSKELIERVKHYEDIGITLLSSYHDGYEVVDTSKWSRYPLYEKRLADYYINRKTTVEADGYHLPFEGLKHQRTLILMPFRSDTWRNKAIPAQKAFKDVIMAIAEHENVTVGIHPAIYKKVAPEFEDTPNVEAVSIRYNDSWARDNMPLFVTNGKSVRSVDFRFNAWGGSYNGLYRNYKDDDHLAAIISKRMKLLSYYLPNFVLEGGSIAVDGEGTLITTEACLLSKGRNPTFRKSEIEEILRDFTGAEKIIWVPHGIYQDETDEHVDNMIAYIRPGEVVMAWTDDEDDPQHQYCLETYRALEEAVDAKGRKLIIHKMPLPSPALYLSAEESKGLVNRSSTIERRNAGRRLAASYVNYYQGSDFVIMPAFGVKEDEEALKIMKELYPGKTIHQIYSKEILLGGGNIHCITMQVPCKEE
jgi:lysine decarboxylase